MQKKKEKFLNKIVKKDYNNELEMVLEKKSFDESAKNLLLSILYKIEASYKDYEKVKRNVMNKETYIQMLINMIEKNCNSITICKMNSKETNILGDRTFLVDKEKKRIICYPIERKLLYCIAKISKKDEKYNFLVYHNAKNTVSNIVNNGVNILDGELEFNVSGFVSKGITGCDINQSGRIINMTENPCTIKPNLFIDEEDVVANHSALIGTFSPDEIFYLMSRGISKRDSENLLTKGFLLNGITYYRKTLEEMINKYWR